MALGMDHCSHRGRSEEHCGWVVALAEPEATEMLGLHSCLLPKEGNHVPITWTVFPLSLPVPTPHFTALSVRLQLRIIQTHPEAFPGTRETGD